jgi:phospholipase C
MMGFALRRSGLHVDWGMDLPFDNRMDVRFDVETGLEDENPAEAFEVKANTHLWLLFSAASLVEGESPVGKTLYRLIQPWNGVLHDDFHDALCRALWDADHRAPYTDPVFDLIPTWQSHFYDPDTRMNWTGHPGPTALSQGSRYFRQSLLAYRRKEWEAAGYALGLAVHYLSDMTQPMHAANFTWLDSQPWGYHTDFERYTKHILERVGLPCNYRPLLNETEPAPYIHAAARYSKDNYYGQIVKSEWTQHYEEADREDAVWEARVGAVMPSILHDAVQVTAQFLLLWGKDATIGG